ncbi:MAG: hypothetical protein C0593_12810 [Marinilabiliales bacterium]|jgi:hypothetical protein|nr:MAG: hypothetical protein C0593_12810 [Marinilabiliales bacterium]
MENSWKQVYSSGNPVHIDILQNLFLEKDIKSVFVNKQDSSYLFGEIELYVKETDILQARQIIRKFEENEKAG